MTRAFPMPGPVPGPVVHDVHDLGGSAGSAPSTALAFRLPSDPPVPDLQGFPVRRTLLGRDTEFDLIERLLETADEGGASLVLHGPPGMGKSELCRWAEQAARRRGTTTVACRGNPLERRLAYGALTVTLHTLTGRASGFHETPQHREALRYAEALLPAVSADAPEPHVVGAGVAAVLRGLAGTGPVLLLVDDMHWLDGASGEVLWFALRRLRTEPLALLATTDLTESSPPGSRAVAEELGATVWQILPLTKESCLGVVQEQLDDPLPRSAAEELLAVTGGNPGRAVAVATELNRAQSLPGRPDRLPLPDPEAETTAQAIDLPEDVRRMLEAAAAMDTPTRRELQALTGVARCDALLSSAMGSGLVGLSGEVLVFRDAATRSWLYRHMDDGDRRSLHRRLAEAVDDPDEALLHRAWSVTEADRTLASHLMTAAAAAERHGSLDRAVDLSAEAVRLSPWGPSLHRHALRAARWCLVHGDAALAHRLLMDAFQAADTRPRAHASANVLVRWLWRHRHPAGAVRVARRTDASLYEVPPGRDGGPDLPLVDEHVLARCLAVCASLLSGDVEAAGAAAGTVSREAANGSPLARVAARVAAAWVLAATDLSAARESLHQCAVVPEPEESEVVLNPAYALAVIDLWTGALGAARATLEDLHLRLDSARRHADVAWVLVTLAKVELESGDWQAADQLARSAAELARSTGQTVLLPWALAVSAHVAARRGSRNAARRHAEEGQRLAEACGVPAAADACRAAQLHLAVADQDGPAAGALLAGFRTCSGPHATTFLPDLVEAFIAVGDLEQAERACARLAAHRDRHLADEAFTAADRCAALLAVARRDLDTGHALLADVMRRELSSTPVFERARTRLCLGILARRRRQRRVAEEHLSAARELFEALEAAPWTARTDRELDAWRPNADGGLTKVEEQVVALAKTGQTNREIARTLYLSTKTIEAHLSRVYRKTGTRGRAQLMASLSAEHVASDTPSSLGAPHASLSPETPPPDST